MRARALIIARARARAHPGDKRASACEILRRCRQPGSQSSRRTLLMRTAKGHCARVSPPEMARNCSVVRARALHRHQSQSISDCRCLYTVCTNTPASECATVHTHTLALAHTHTQNSKVVASRPTQILRGAQIGSLARGRARVLSSVLPLSLEPIAQDRPCRRLQCAAQPQGAMSPLARARSRALIIIRAAHEIKY